MLPPANPSQTAADKLALREFINITHFYHCQSWLKKNKQVISACLATSAVCSASLLGHPFPGQVFTLVFIFVDICPVAWLDHVTLGAEDFSSTVAVTIWHYRFIYYSCSCEPFGATTVYFPTTWKKLLFCEFMWCLWSCIEFDIDDFTFC